METQILLDDRTLEQTEIVANNAMNRERGIAGPNSYTKDLGFDLVAYVLDRLETTFPFTYLGADDQAGPNYTGQPVADSWYAQE